jgi:hypothetical protein
MENNQLALRFDKSTFAKPNPFPPRRDYTSLSILDLVEAREAYHVHLSRLDNVVATAIGRYRIHQKDWFATNAPDEPRPVNLPRTSLPRTLSNSIVRPWSWPAVLVFVRKVGAERKAWEPGGSFIALSSRWTRRSDVCGSGYTGRVRATTSSWTITSKSLTRRWLFGIAQSPGR